MRVQSKRVGSVIGALVLAGSAFVVVASISAGCGGKTDEPPATPPPTDSGSEISVVDSTADTGPKDTGSKPDTAVSYDVPGSIFDAPIPDVELDGVSIPKCVDCLKTKCKSELETCDADPKCRGLTLCVLIDCKGSFTDTTCLFGCAGKFGVTGFDDPVVPKVMAIGDCSNKNCKAECPAPDAGPPPSDGGPKDGATESGSADGSGGSGGFSPSPGSPASPKSFAKAMSIDPRVIEVLQSLCMSMDGDPDLKKGAIDVLSHE